MRNETLTRTEMHMAQEALAAHAKQLNQFADRVDKDLIGKEGRRYADSLRKEAAAFESLSAKMERMFWAAGEGGAA